MINVLGTFFCNRGSSQHLQRFAELEIFNDVVVCQSLSSEIERSYKRDLVATSPLKAPDVLITFDVLPGDHF